jgi:3-oxoacyl-[acyl-carrier protein] reductase
MTFAMHAGRVAVITGAGQGIGLHLARALAQAGAKVVLNDIEGERLDRAVAELRGAGLDCTAAVGDVAQPEQSERLVAQAVATYGRLDYAVANAGVTVFGAFLDYSPAELRRVLDTNLGGSFFLAQAAARRMREQGTGGRLLFLSSVTGHQAHQNLVAYGMTKAALEMLAKGLVIELSRYRITANAIAPGATLTERTLGDPAYERVWADLTPLGRAATTADVAAAALFLLSDAAAHITGQTLVVDGGWTCVSPPPPGQ